MIPRTLKCATRSASFAALLVGTLHSNEVKIFDNTRKICIRTRCSIDAERVEWRVRRYFGGDCPIDFYNYSGDHTGLDTVGGELVLSKRNPWISQIPMVIAAARAKCPDCPVIFIAQSGSGFEDNEVVVDDVCDPGRIDAVVERIKAMCDRVREAGADVVMWATYPFNHRHRRFGEMEPHIVTAFNRKYPQYRGIDCVTPVLDAWPLANVLDMTHLCDYGKEMQGHEWFKAMLAHDGITEVPKWSSDSIEAARIRELRIREEMAKSWKFPRNGGRYALGDEMIVEFNPSADYLKLLGGDCKTQLELKFRRIDREDQRIFGSKSRVYWDRASNAWTNGREQLDVCTPQTFRLPVNREAFELIGDNALKYPVPVFLGAGVSGVGKEHWVGTYAAYDNIDSMIVLYPVDSVDASKTPYPMNYGDRMPVWPIACDPSPVVREHRPTVAQGPFTIDRGRARLHCTRDTRVTIVDVSGKLIHDRAHGAGEKGLLGVPRRNGVCFVLVRTAERTYGEKICTVGLR
jgi:hypothetical protein